MQPSDYTQADDLSDVGELRRLLLRDMITLSSLQSRMARYQLELSEVIRQLGAMSLKGRPYMPQAEMLTELAVCRAQLGTFSDRERQFRHDHEKNIDQAEGLIRRYGSYHPIIEKEATQQDQSRHLQHKPSRLVAQPMVCVTGNKEIFIRPPPLPVSCCGVYVNILRLPKTPKEAIRCMHALV